ncbi:MAG: type I methionyl aminopeptidase, partial [Candidatus Omnitrophica bacterium]|nr:type I methionyl aminopeptidase [Candidatus Omnitrophota bacterium]MBD3268789.1 type I methionyl aminopeptidase [Candidatus Omnitrophota bacterium]
GMEPAFKGYMGYPASCCVSVDEEIIHGIPSESKVIEDGSLISVDLGIKYKGVFVDTACTYIAGKASALAKKLVKVSLKSLHRGIKQVKIDTNLGNVSHSIQNFVEKNGFSVIRKFVGHGIGRELHLPPEIPNFGKPGSGWKMQEGYALAIEPMIATGGFEVEIMPDGWTAKTKDNSLAAHFEHTVVITKRGPVVMTA